MPATRRSLHYGALLSFFLISLLVVIAYLPGLHGPFLFDDGINITQNPAVIRFTFDNAGWGRILAEHRPLAIATFALNYRLGGAHPFSFKLVNLLIHIVNGALVFWLSHLLITLRNRPSTHDVSLPPVATSALTSLLWSLHPIQLTAVLYVVQRMTSLSAMCVLSGLILFLNGRCRLSDEPRRARAMIWGGILGGSFLGFGFKENAILLPLFAAVIELIFYGQNWRHPTERRQLLLTYSMPLAVLSGGVLAWLSTRPDALNSIYSLREFTLFERLLTEPRVLWFYVSLILFPQITHFSLFHDDFTLSTGLFSPPMTFVALLGLIAVAVFALIGRRRYPVLAFAILWFLAGQALESTFIGLELVHEHRNYLPSFGLIFAVACGLSRLAAHPHLKKTIPVVSVAAALAVGFTTRGIASTWTDVRTLAEQILSNHPNSPRAHVMLADLSYLQNRQAVPAMRQYLIAFDLDRAETAYIIRAAQIAFETTVVLAKPSNVSETFRDRDGNAMIVLARDTHGSISYRPTPLLYERIADGLRSQPIQARTMISLDELTRCIESSCRPLLLRAIEWNRLALGNPRTTDKFRLRLLVQSVSLQLDAGNIAKARYLSKKALALSPDRPAIVLMAANVEMLSGDLAAASALVRGLREKAQGTTAEEQQEIEKFLLIVRSRNNASNEQKHSDHYPRSRYKR